MAIKRDFSQMKALKKRLEEAAGVKEAKEFNEACVRELAARFLAKVIKRTPTGLGAFEVIRDDKNNAVKYKRGKNKGKVKLQRLSNGGTLKRAWTAYSENQAESGRTLDATSFARNMKVKKIGTSYQVTITNPMQYASYVEYGHRQTPGRYVPALGKRLKKSWVPGVFMMTISESEVQKEAPRILRKKLKARLQEVFHGK